MTHSIPAALVFSGLDPAGGAGIQADIEALASQGCHACPLITSLTTQDTVDVKNTKTVDPELLLQQALCIIEDIPISAVKIGLIDHPETAVVIAEILGHLPNIPVILDPVLASGANTELGDASVRSALTECLLPLTTILTPNSKEARLLAPLADTLSACAMSLLDEGCEFVLITGTHEPTEQVSNSLYSNHRLLDTFNWPRLPGEYHGSGCTLASSITGLLAQGNEPLSAIHEAQEYTWQSLEKSYRVGSGQSIPNRFFWANNSD